MVSLLEQEAAVVTRDEPLETSAQRTIRQECGERWSPRNELVREAGQLAVRWVEPPFIVVLTEHGLRSPARSHGHANAVAQVRSGRAHRSGATEQAKHDDAFAALVRKWKADTAHMSIVSRMVEHPAYQSIISMGYAAVPLLLNELRREPDHWFVALRRITGANPVPADARGNVSKMIEAWLA